MDAKKILVIDDDNAIREALSTLLERNHYVTVSAGTGIEGMAMVNDHHPDLVLSDIMMPEMDGFEMLLKIKEMDSDLPVILMTGFSSIGGAIQAIKMGADEYLTKPLDHVEVLHVIEKSFENQTLAKQNQMLKQRLSDRVSMQEIIGESAGTQKVKTEIRRSAASDISVLILGQSGVGKELVAQAIHRQSQRHKEDFVAINCAAIPAELLESELFGHEKGAFSGATNRKYGLFEMADKGTLFLDEIGEMSQSLQAKMLRAIETHKIRRIGSTKEVHSDFRLISSTNIDLEAAMKNKQFREDLYYRISPFIIEVSGLKDRTDDIELLVHHFLNTSGHSEVHISPEFIAALKDYHWPGNIRELKNIIERAVLLGDGSGLDVESLGTGWVGRGIQGANTQFSSTHTLAEVEQIQISQVLKKYSNNKTMTAKSLGISLKTLYNKLNTYTR